MFLAPGGGPKSTAWGGCEGKGQKKSAIFGWGGGGGPGRIKIPLVGGLFGGRCVPLDKYALNLFVCFCSFFFDIFAPFFTFLLQSWLGLPSGSWPRPAAGTPTSSGERFWHFLLTARPSGPRTVIVVAGVAEGSSLPVVWLVSHQTLTS